ncbi:UDP-Glycosyltransferase/glycogen phosphorylase [Aspergillus sclerotioniger CBS 115572]|uniref:UDP-Glycosyltransferase/glycogen phosphorylase n=1 Tax=Aspergillus sclerotioniger CBS 115572 TaxID=1450535 RepID=A0A317VQW4_9EURO|nr:UDP-Glycosyltransferase/glycogen phosphorylase [Aspergillus sclerotioniger CBS 115572]PWY75298.1 UDP-Glycosyltransferase/glycogen phosphorylase [Aspergillus sclerotioniger CBS 115572]
MAPKPLPLVIIACPPEHGHTLPLLPHATHLSQQGYEVHFIAGSALQDAITQTGANFHPVQTVITDEKLEQIRAIPEGPDRLIHAMKVTFLDLIPESSKSLKAVLEKLREEQPGREIVIVQEWVSMGTMPFVLGAPLPKGFDKLPPVISFTTVPLTVSSIDTAPFGPGLPPDSSEEGRARNIAMYKGAADTLDLEINNYINAVVANLGATEQITEPFFNNCLVGADLLAVPYNQTLEYPRSDLSPKVRFIGATPRKPLNPSIPVPEWWGEVLEAKQGANPKKVIFVSQGTFILDYRMLLIPSIEALAARDDCLVVGVLGQKGAKLDGVTVPANTRIIDYLPYELILPHADVFVCNAGFGGFLTSLMHGVPMVLAGEGQDKAEVAMRGEYAGVGVNLRSATPSQEAIQKGIDDVLTNKAYKTRCLEHQAENEKLNGLVQLEKLIQGFV